MGLAQSTTRAEQLNRRRIHVLTGELEAFEAVRERYPTLDWQDFDGAVLIHSSHNTMKNQLAVLEWNRTEIMRGRRLADRLRLRWPAARETALNTHTAHHAQVTFADGIQTIPRSDSAHTACKTAEVSSVQSDTEDADCALLEASAGVSCGQSHRPSNSPPIHATSDHATPAFEDIQSHVDICRRSTFKSLPRNPCTDHGSFKRYNRSCQHKMLNRRMSV